MTLSSLLRAAPTVDLAAIDSRSTPGFAGDKAAGEAALAALAAPLADVQERLFAEGVSGGRRSVLVVLQGMDTSGKDGTIRKVVGMVDPQGVRIFSFKRPTSEELAHDFLWRIRRRLPEPGLIGVFNRSHYEDVLIVRVHDLVPREAWERRYDAINAFEAELAEAGTTVIKVFLHISATDQEERLAARLEERAKHWKWDSADLDERRYWSAYQEAYEAVLTRCNPDSAPWYVVPAGRKWYRNWAVATLLHETLTAMGPTWPDPGLDVPALRARLQDEKPG
ncbi:PPK2 family polyphosphate kinase [Sporichthya polymorpha]|uniref:PPK2 family polyphosphate kinase n=1 Tax=Sporichthya polymorpha TaxID=35751 RepID=UPI00037B480B|nr:PPK2 family polyphosphate kinase [Sporichthya polymorpha]